MRHITTVVTAILVLALLPVLSWSSPPAAPDAAASESSSDDPATADEPAEDHGEEGAAHHDAYDLSAANAGDTQASMFELRADLALATLGVFVLLLLILYKFAWGPIAEALDRREQGIANQLDEARRNNEQARELLAQHESKLAATADQVREILEGARRDADTQKQSIIGEAEQAASAEKDRAVREIAAAKNSALLELAETSVDHAIRLAGQIVGKQLSKDDHSKLIEEAVRQFPSDI